MGVFQPWGKERPLETDIGNVYPCAVLGPLKEEVLTSLGNIPSAWFKDKSKVKAISKIIACIA